MLLVGAAYPAGALPLPAEAIETAIRLNGAQVDTNLLAFGHGRRLVARPEDEPAPAPLGIDELIAHRTADLTEYQDARYAAAYARFVTDVRAREHAVRPGSTELTGSVARALHKLMAYKDEYEVARLCLDPAFDRSVRDQWGAGAKVHYRLHPPVLRAPGMDRKIALGPWFRPAFRALRRLRGTAWDPFGRAHVREVERELITEYRGAVEAASHALTERSLPTAAELAELPDLVRGYERIKLDNVERYRVRLRALLDQLGPPR
ncbi:DUF6537 domain-containing protein [Saccharopolyspora sp. CA-218241]|uniref:DUF6537 domain-containing protein n=1 Tax=Saccharopolyspora sp. CA-218241 TaxID=3240027 RepID=UPI003D987786